MSNKFDPRSYTNPAAGRKPRPGGANNPLVRPTPDSGYSRSKSPYGAEVARHGLVYRSLEDGENLIEGLRGRNLRERGRAVEALVRDIEEALDYPHGPHGPWGPQGPRGVSSKLTPRSDKVRNWSVHRSDTPTFDDRPHLEYADWSPWGSYKHTFWAVRNADGQYLNQVRDPDTNHPTGEWRWGSRPDVNMPGTREGAERLAQKSGFTDYRIQPMRTLV